MEQTALIIVDVQNDFLPPDGSLAVPGGREVIPAIKSLLDDEGVWDWRAVVATQVSLKVPSLSGYLQVDERALDRITTPKNTFRSPPVILTRNHSTLSESRMDGDAGWI